MFEWALTKVFGSKHQREIRKLQPKIDAINGLESKLEKLSDADLKARTADFKQKLDNGASLDDLLIPAFATVREAGKRVFGMRHYDVQLIGGMVLHSGRIAEMRTGEGKTLVATLPCYLNALEGKGVHVVTVNDYLASRDAEWMGQLYGWLGLSTGIAVPRQSNVQKKRAYACDITYGQNNEFGFDYMRDNMKFSIYDYVQRDLNFAIVDEVDSILIDEARTPLIISGPGETASEKYIQITELIPRLRRDEHYEVDEKSRTCTLTEEGNELSQRLLREKGMLDESGNLFDPVNLETLHILQQCLRAHALFHRDQNYMVSGEKVMIIDEFTGRTLPGRRWSDGLHQAVEAKERVPIQDESITLATISFQNLFRLYNKLSGMTGTADTEAAEFHSIYDLDTVVIPTNKPIARVDEEDLVYKSEREKFKAVAHEIKDLHEAGKPVLVGTTSVEKSDALARVLDKLDIPHNVLNAKQHEREAYVVAQAGTRGAVTVATNMAGRGTDIVLGGNAEMLARMSVMQQADPELLADADRLQQAVDAVQPEFEKRCKEEQQKIKDLGGLHIIGTERHESRRVDNQLRGRAGRQGDPGHSRFFLSLEDELIRIFQGERVSQMMDRMGMEEDIPIEHRWVTRSVENAQKKVEERNFDIRKNLLEYDDVMNQQRKSMYALRKQVLRGEYRETLTDEQRKKGVIPKAFVKEADPELGEKISPLLRRLLQVHCSPVPAAEVTQEELDAYRDEVFQKEIADLGPARPVPLERDIYLWFGCVVELRKRKDDPVALLAYLQERVALSLTEQRERLLDLVDEMVGTMVEHACPLGKPFDEWDLDGLEKAYKQQFAMDATGLDEFHDQHDLAKKLYADVEAVLTRKERELTPESFFRFFRNTYLQEIDRQWIEHLQSMDHLRGGIGLRGYGQRDPKKEYKREGFIMFQAMRQSVSAAVVETMCRVERATEAQLEALEAQRRAQSEKRAAPAAQPQAGGDQAGGGQKRQVRRVKIKASRRGGTPREDAPLSRKERRRAKARGADVAEAAPEEAATFKREAPKLGRNDPCHCGSGKKYKNCHMREDQAALRAEG